VELALRRFAQQMRCALLRLRHAAPTHHRRCKPRHTDIPFQVVDETKSHEVLSRWRAAQFFIT
jgi:hypothetical protein